MFRFAFTIITSLLVSSSVFAFIPTQLINVEAKAREAVINKYIELATASAEQHHQVYYHNFKSGVGKYGADFGDFKFSGEIWISNQRKFSCVTTFLRAGYNKNGTFIVDAEDLNSNSKCTEVSPTK
ncbi:hypothetical protein D3C72_1355240 [compost metagenome]